MKNIFGHMFLLLFLCFSYEIYAQKQQRDILIDKYQSFLDVHYGIYDRNTFDLYLPQVSNGPCPLVVYFHGGGFTQGDKSKIKAELSVAQELLGKGVAFASVNYRYRESDDSLGVQKCIQDAVRFIQFIRFHSDEYNIDKSEIGCYGESAGAGISLYLAFHNDLANPDSPDLAERESSRISCAGAVATQSTYNLFRWKCILPGYWLIFNLKRKSLNQMIANFYGYKSFREFKPHKKDVIQKLDMLKMISSDDPPVWLCNQVSDKISKGVPHNENQLYHHPAHAEVVAKKAHRAGVVNYLITNEKEKSEVISEASFFEKYLRVK